MLVAARSSLRSSASSGARLTIQEAKYTAQLRNICLDTVVTSGWDTESPPDLHSVFRTLVGGVAGLTLTAPDISVHVAFLQRQLAKPTLANIRDLDRLVLWVQKRPQRICFEALTPPLRLVCVTDSAFQAQATDGLARRGCLLLVAGSDAQGQWQKDAVPAPQPTRRHEPRLDGLDGDRPWSAECRSVDGALGDRIAASAHGGLALARACA